MKLVFDDLKTHWRVAIYDDAGIVLFDQKNVFFSEDRTPAHFKWWEEQIRSFPNFNITEVENNIEM